MIATTLGRSVRGRTDTPGGPSERATPPTVRVWSDALKISSARCIFRSALVGTARTWRGRRGGSGTRRAGGSLLRRRALAGRGELVLHLAGALAARPQAIQERPAAAVVPGVAQLQLVAAGLADPALVLRPRGAQVADLAPRAAGQERLRVLTAQQRPPADVAGQIALVGVYVAGTGHGARAG